MAQLLKWDLVGERIYETGVRHGVFFLKEDDGTYPLGEVWNGLTAVNVAPTGGEANPQYADDIKYLNLQSMEEFAATIECLTYPKNFQRCEGKKEIIPGMMIAQQIKAEFGMSWRTTLGNDTEGTKYGYIIHVAYGLLANPSERNYATMNETPEPIALSYEVTSTPVELETAEEADDYLAFAHIEFNSTKLSEAQMTKVKEILYGVAAVTGDTPKEAVEARLPLPDEWITILKTIT